MLYRTSDEKRERDESEHTHLGRNPFRRDYDRLLHSPSFRRLQGKTQLFPGHESDFFRNRLTHSLEVAQVAKGIAQKLNSTVTRFIKEPISIDIVEFAGLAHDLGHPPFGHNGEKALDDCMKHYGGFEGNAQTLRILTKIEKKSIITDDDIILAEGGISRQGIDYRLGINATARSLASIIKYDSPIELKRERRSALRKGYYESESNIVEKIKSRVGQPIDHNIPFKTIECQIMDIADDISYSMYDLEDSMKGGFTSPIEILSKISDQSLIKKLHEKVIKEIPSAQEQEVFEAVRGIFISDQQDNILEEYKLSKLISNNSYYRTGFCSEFVGKFILSVNVDVNENDLKFSKITVERKSKMMIESLKHLNYILTIMSPRLKVVEYRGYEIVKRIFETLDSEEGHLLMPDDLQVIYNHANTTDTKKRLICDFVAGMTDRYAIEFYSRLDGGGASIYKPI